MGHGATEEIKVIIKIQQNINLFRIIEKENLRINQKKLNQLDLVQPSLRDSNLWHVPQHFRAIFSSKIRVVFFPIKLNVINGLFWFPVFCWKTATAQNIGKRIHGKPSLRKQPGRHETWVCSDE